MKQALRESYLKFRQKERDKKYPHMAELLDKDSLSTNKCQILYAHIGLDIRSPYYGKIVGAFMYKDWFEHEPNAIIEFVFHIHEPNQGRASLSNQMQSVDKISMLYMPDGEERFFANNQQFGKLAYKHIPEKYLTDDDLALYQFTKNLRAYSRKHNCCSIFRKSDKQHLQYVAETSATECVCEHTTIIKKAEV